MTSLWTKRRKMVVASLALLLVYMGVTCEAKRPPLGQSIILIVADGYGSALLNNSKAESTLGFTQIAQQGVKAEYLKPTFPTLAIPSWHSLATGLYTESHGMTFDKMYDPNTTRTYEGGSNKNDSSHFWWKGRPAPFWYSAGKANIDVNCYWFSYCHQPFGDLAVLIPPERRADLDNPEQTEAMPLMFDEMITRIDKYQPYRKQIFLIRYAMVDAALRQFGPGTDEVEQAIAKLDLHIHELQGRFESVANVVSTSCEKMETANLFDSTNLIVLSEHGLARVVEEEQFYLEECLSDYSNVRMVVTSKSMLILHTAPGAEDSVFFELKVCDQWVSVGDYEDDTNPVEVYRSNSIPEKFHLGRGRFLGNIVIMTKPGTTVITRELPSVHVRNSDGEKEEMADGWDADSESMRGIFLARGPAFKVGEKHEHIELVDMYNVLLNIVGLEAAHPNNGSWDRVGSMLTDDWEDRASSPRTSSDFTTLFYTSCVLVIARFL